MLARIVRWVLGVVVLQGGLLIVLAWLLPGFAIEGLAAGIDPVLVVSRMGKLWQNRRSARADRGGAGVGHGRCGGLGRHPGSLQPGGRGAFTGGLRWGYRRGGWRSPGAAQQNADKSSACARAPSASAPPSA
jgi:hypothetical protein